MDKNLSVASRILVAFASGALIAVFFLPAWRIDLFAPQYPEGLKMNIWIDGLSGEIDVINGLNHYIGMKPITEDMFPEFRFLPYVVGFFMLLGLLVAVSGRRKFLFLYLVLTVLGGAAALWDFYHWGKQYGNDLDPKAPIQVPGLSYQPPLFGHKRILNFDAYSFPDVGGWIVIGAGVLALGVWVVEWYHRRRSLRVSAKPKIRMAVAASALIVVLAGCSAKPEPFRYGQDNCHFCKMQVTDPRFGAEVITRTGKLYKFDDLNCLLGFLRSGEVAAKDIRRKLVIDFEKENEFLDAEAARFCQNPQLRSPMGANTAALDAKQAAWCGENGGKLLSWPELNQTLK